MLEPARKAGSRLLIPTVANMCAAVGVGYIINRTKVVRPTIRFGATTLTLGCIGLACLSSSFPEILINLMLIPSNAGIGFAYPSMMMGTLASSAQEEMAVATSTLILFRSLGNVMGVSTSSLIVQNALLWGLKRNLVVGGTEGLVSEEQKARVIEMVRERVTAVFDLQGEIQDQGKISSVLRKLGVLMMWVVVDAYRVSLRLTFAWAAGCAAIMLLATWNLKIPRMDARTKKSQDRSVRSVISESTEEGVVTEETSLLLRRSK